MKLGGARDGRLWATDGRRVIVERAAGESFGSRGRLPAPSGRTAWLTDGVRARLTRRVVGTVPTTNCWPLTDTDLLATVGRDVYSSHDGGRTWDRRRRLPPSAGTMGVLPAGVCVADGRVYLAPYTADDPDARVLVSDDWGRQWTRHATIDARHVHCVTQDPDTGDVWLATGDRDEECRIGRLADGEFRPIGGGSQHWRAVEVAFGPETVLWGVDSATVQSRIYALDRTDRDPRPVATTRGSVYYAASWSHDGTRWVAFSTAIETGYDSTAPEARSGLTPDHAPYARVVASSEASDFESWQSLATYRKRPCVADRVPGTALPSANSYVFLAGVDGRGLVYNPFNTRRHDGSIRLARPTPHEARTETHGWSTDTARGEEFD